MKTLTVTVLACFLTIIALSDSDAFMKEGCGGGACADCHSLTSEEAVKILGGMVDNA